MAISQTINAITTTPSIASPATFEADVNTLLNTELPALQTQLNTFAGQANTLETNVNTKEASAVAAAASALSAKTGAMAAANYAGTWAALVGALAKPATVYHASVVWLLLNDLADVTLSEPGVTADWIGLSVGNHEVVVHTGNGHGSINDKIRRFTTALTNVGTAITYADSATLGASFTINDSGFYAIYFAEFGNAVGFGVSLNSAALTTSIATIPIATRLIDINSVQGGGYIGGISRIVLLVAGDVIRPHTDGAPSDTSDKVLFSIRKVGNV